MEVEVDDLKQVRIDKLNNLKELGISPYGNKFDRSHVIGGVLKDFAEEVNVTIAGRIMAHRKHGKVIFIDLQDQTAKIQLFVKQDNLGEEKFSLFKELDIGDIIGVTGETFTTNKGQESVRVKEMTVLSKSLNSLPEKFHGLKNIDARYRQRYVDLIINNDVRDVFIKRSKITSLIRNFWYYCQYWFAP